ncbi:type II secretion system F family protein [Desulfurispora thermophila]|uniref:type II secretion system F family protein n=1 Tax=Desulfurispora thermophila TaxID=265470 RepID=UPI00037BB1D5|nr:type II secretion system F family protein [Desulfurispora thermophila]
MDNIPYTIPVAVFLVNVWAFNVMLSGPEDRDYPAISYLMQLTRKEEAGLKRILKPFMYLAGKMNEGKKQTMAEEIRFAGLNITPEEVLARQVISGLGVFLVAVTVAIALKNKPILVAAPFLGILSYTSPKTKLKKKVKEKKEAIRNELPDFIDTMLLLTEAGFTPYEAIKQSTQYMGGVLGEELREMVIEMEATSDDIGTLQRFAERLGINELRNFVAAMIQASTVDTTKANEIYAQQSQYMREMRAANIRKLTKSVPGKVRKYNFLILVLVLATVFIPLMVTVSRSFNFGF